MATLTPTGVTLVDHTKMFDPAGNLLATAEVLNESTPIIRDAFVMEANLPTAHRHNVRVGLPRGTWTRFYGAVSQTKSERVQVDDGIGMLEAYSEIDTRVANLGGKPEAIRNDEDRAHIEGMGQDLEDAFFYDNALVNPERPTGLAPRFNALSGAATSNQIINAGGATDLTSIWFVTWGAGAVSLIYPRGSTAGLSVEDLGIETKETADGLYRVYRTHFKHDVGVTVADWRYVVRIANIDTAALTDAGESAFDGTEIVLKLIEAYHKLPLNHRPMPADAQGAGNARRPVIYMNRTIATALDKLARKDTITQLTNREFGGEYVTTFRGIPIRETDALLNTETAVA